MRYLLPQIADDLEDGAVGGKYRDYTFHLPPKPLRPAGLVGDNGWNSGYIGWRGEALGAVWNPTGGVYHSDEHSAGVAGQSGRKWEILVGNLHSSCRHYKAEIETCKRSSSARTKGSDSVNEHVSNTSAVAQ